MFARSGIEVAAGSLGARHDSVALGQFWDSALVTLRDIK
jgi:hypothetical protein